MNRRRDAVWPTVRSDKRGRHLINFLVNSPNGTFFLGSVDASHEVHDAYYLANLLEKKMNEIGAENVVQVVTDNGVNYKAAGRILMERFPSLYWTPCAAHCLDLMLDDIGGMVEFKGWISKAKYVTTFIYRHLRLLNALRELTGGRDLVRPAATRFATSFYTLQSLYRHRDALRKLFVTEDWCRSKLGKTQTWKNVSDVVLSTAFWNVVEDCIRATHPILIVLRLVDGDEKPAMAELTIAMNMCKEKLKENFARKERLLERIMEIVDRRWEDQMEQNLHGAALFLNPQRFFNILESDSDRATIIRNSFNRVMMKMFSGDEQLLSKIDVLADDYEQTRGSFDTTLARMQRKKKSPLDWWKSNGGLAIPLQKVAKRIVGLCCSSSGCERNWSTFEFLHTKKRNRLEFKRLNDLVYISYNKKIASRFQRLSEQGNKYNPLFLEEFQWDNEWVDKDAALADQVHAGEDDLLWSHVDEAVNATSSLRGRNFPRRARVDVQVYSRRTSPSTRDHEEEDMMVCDDEDVEDEF